MLGVELDAVDQQHLLGLQIGGDERLLDGLRLHGLRPVHRIREHLDHGDVAHRVVVDVAAVPSLELVVHGFEDRLGRRQRRAPQLTLRSEVRVVAHRLVELGVVVEPALAEDQRRGVVELAHRLPDDDAVGRVRGLHQHVDARALQFQDLAVHVGLLAAVRNPERDGDPARLRHLLDRVGKVHAGGGVLVELAELVPLLALLADPVEILEQHLAALVRIDADTEQVLESALRQLGGGRDRRVRDAIALDHRRDRDGHAAVPRAHRPGRLHRGDQTLRLGAADLGASLAVGEDELQLRAAERRNTVPSGAEEPAALGLDAAVDQVRAEFSAELAILTGARRGTRQRHDHADHDLFRLGQHCSRDDGECDDGERHQQATIHERPPFIVPRVPSAA